MTTFELPVFTDLREFQASEWFSYYDALYDSPGYQPDDFPLSPGELWILSTTLMTRCDISYPTPTDDCPADPNELFAHMSGYPPYDHDPPGWAWLYKRERPYPNQPSSTLVEVTHCAYPGEAVGSWCYVMPGSGVYLATGKTIAFPDHQQGVRYFLDEYCPNTECNEFFDSMFTEALRQQYDTVQFTSHADMRCSLNLAVEIVDLHGRGEFACGAEDPNTPEYRTRYRTGWKGRDPCVCDAARKCLNCSPAWDPSPGC